MHTKCNWDIESSSAFLLLWFSYDFKLCLFNDAVTNSSRHCRITNTVLERRCKVAPWPIEFNYPEVTDRPRETSVMIITLLFEIRLRCFPNSTQKPYHLNPFSLSYSSYWSSSKRSCNRRRGGCDYLLRCTRSELLTVRNISLLFSGFPVSNIRPHIGYPDRFSRDFPEFLHVVAGVTLSK